MMDIIFPPGPNSEKGKPIFLLNRENSVEWLSSNKIVNYDLSTQATRMTSFKNKKLTSILHLQNDSTFIGNEDGEVSLLEKNGHVFFSHKALDGEVQSLLYWKEKLFIAGGGTKFFLHVYTFEDI